MWGYLHFCILAAESTNEWFTGAKHDDFTVSIKKFSIEKATVSWRLLKSYWVHAPLGSTWSSFPLFLLLAKSISVTHTPMTLLTTAFSWEVAVTFPWSPRQQWTHQVIWYLWLNYIQRKISNYIQRRSIKAAHIQHASIVWVCDGKTIWCHPTNNQFSRNIHFLYGK